MRRRIKTTTNADADDLMGLDLVDVRALVNNAGLAELVRFYQLDRDHFGIRVNQIDPGLFAAPMAAAAIEAVRRSGRPINLAS